MSDPGERLSCDDCGKVVPFLCPECDDVALNDPDMEWYWAMVAGVACGFVWEIKDDFEDAMRRTEDLPRDALIAEIREIIERGDERLKETLALPIESLISDERDKREAQRDAMDASRES